MRFELLEARQLLSLQPQLVADINPLLSAAGSSPASFVAVGSTVYFVASTPTAGQELWKTDGTAAGTTLVKDIWPGGGSSSPGFLTNFNGTLFFSANDEVNGAELWKSDGTAAGTVMVANLVAGRFSSSPSYFTEVNGNLFFRANDVNDVVTGYRVYKSDGTAAGTTLLKTITFGTGVPTLKYLTNVNGTLFFRANEESSGSELWKSDGTAAGTTLVKEIRSGSSGSTPSGLANFNGTLFFSANDGASGYELWKSDGTAAGTVMVNDIATGVGSSSPASLANINGTLFFSATDGTNGFELWKSDGTSAGTVLVKNLNSSGSASPTFLTNVNGTLFFKAYTAGSESELCKSDGTTAGTGLVKDIAGDSVSSYVRYLTNVNGTLFFSAADSVNGMELWKSDGSSAGTVLVRDIRSGSSGSTPKELANINGTLFFNAQDGIVGEQPWKSNGSAAGTVLVKAATGASGDSSPDFPANVNGMLFFSASDGTNGVELWKSDGTEAGTVLVKDLRSGSAGSIPKYLTNVNGTLFFSANDGTNGTELWKSDGTAAGTELVKNINSASTSSSPKYLANVNGTLFFSASDGTHGYELWKSDGTATGTGQVKEIRTAALSSLPNSLANFNGTLLFAANDGTNGTELWKSDGTAAGTVLLKDIAAGTAGSYPGVFTNVNGTVFFSANDGSHGTELWKSDGTAAGTVLLKDLSSGIAGSFPAYLTNVNGTLFFHANDGTYGTELWKSDGTAAGTGLVKDIRTGTTVSWPNQLTNVNGTLFFGADDGIHGEELWMSDGTPAGTVLASDLTPSGASSPSTLINFNGTLFFTATDATFGRELWRLVDDSLPNNAPVLDNTGTMVLDTILEDDPTATGTLVSQILASAGGDRITDIDANPLEGMAVTAAANTNGTWQFSIDYGLSWTAFGSPAPANARLLAASASTRIRFAPNANYCGSDTGSITFRAWDRTSGSNGGTANTLANGGSTAFSTATETASIVVLSVNDPPAGADKAVTVSQNGTYTFTLADFGFTDSADVPANAFYHVKLTTLPAAGTLKYFDSPAYVGNYLPTSSIATGKLTFTPAANALGSPYTTFTFQVHDDGGTTNGGVNVDPTPRTMTIHVSDIPPTATITAVSPDPRSSAVASMTIVFSEPVTGLGLADLRLTRDGGSNLLTAAQALSTGNNVTWTLANLGGLTADAGSYTLTLTAAGSGITDATAHALAGDASENWIVDPVAPTVSITAVSPDPRYWSVSTMTIVFSEAVTGLDVADLTLTRDGGVNLLSGSQTVTSSDGITWTLQYLSSLTSTAGNYVLTLNATGAGIADQASNPLTSGASESWTVDTTAPTVGITPVSPDPHNSAVDTITIVFSEPVSGFDLADLSLKRDGGANLLTAAQTLSTGDSITWTLGGLGGLTGASGSYVLTISSSGTGIHDAAGVYLGAGTSESWTTDSDAPTATITAVDPDPQSGGIGGILIVFSKPVLGFDLADLSLTRDGGGNLLTAAQWLLTGDNITWTLNGLYGLTGLNGNYSLTLNAAGSGIVDVAGNVLANSCTENWTADTVKPTLAITPVSPDPRNSSVGSITIVFSEAVTGFDRTDLVLRRDGGGNLLTASQSLSTTDNITWTLGNLGGLTATAGTYVLTLAASGIVDPAGNTMLGDVTETWAVDTTPPTASLASIYPNPRNSPVSSIAIVFSEAVSGFDLADLALTCNAGSNLLSAAQSLSSADNITWTLNGLDGLTASTGSYVLMLTAAGSGITDVAGNAMTADRLRIWLTDMTPPTATITAVTPDPRNSAVSSLTITFSEAINGFDRNDLVLRRDGGSNLLTASQTLTTSDNIVWILGNLGGLTASGGSYRLALTASGSAIADPAGNPMAVDAAEDWTVDKTAPTATITAVSPDPRNSAVGAVQIVFSEAVTGFDLADLTLRRNSGSNLLTAAQTLTTSDNTTWTLGNLDGLTGATGSYLLTLTASGSGIVDAVSNAMTSGATESWTVDATAPTATITAVSPDPRHSPVSAITIVFSEAVSGLDLADLCLARDAGSNLLTPSQTLTSSNAITWTLGNLGQITAAPGSYLLTLNAAGSGIADAATNALAANASESWSVTTMTLTATITAVSPDPRNSAVHSVQVVFNEAVSGFDRNDLSLRRDGGSNLLTASQTLTTSDNITWMLGNLSGVTAAAGSYVLVLTAAGSGIVDQESLALASDASESWLTDTTAPTVTGVTAASAPDAQSLNFTVTFSEAVQNVSADDFRLTTTGTAAGNVAAVSGSSGTAFTVTVQGISGIGSLRVDLASGTDITDSAGNAATSFSGGAAAVVPTDLRMVSVQTAGTDQLTVSYEIVGSPSIPFDLGWYRSTDTAFGSGDVLTGSVAIAATADLAVGLHTQTFTLGGGTGRLALPGAGAEENLFDYYLLGVVDPSNAVHETGSTDGEANNLALLSGVYHVAGGLVMVHGTSAADVAQVLPGGLQLVANGTTFTYAGTDVAGVHVRGHAGNDQFEWTCGGGFSTPANTTLDFLFIGGPGSNTAGLWGSTSGTTLDTASLTPTWGTLVGPGYSLLAKNTTAITVQGNGGPDKGYFTDSTQADTFTAYPTYATLSNGAYTNRLDNFPNVYATASGTVVDTAQLYAGTGNGLDQFSGSPTYAVMTGTTAAGKKYYNRADSFESLIGDSADAEPDVATLYDAAETTTNTQCAFVLNAGQRYGQVQASAGTAGTIRANHFQTTVVGTRDQGADSATLYGSSAADTIQAKMYAKEVWLVPTTGTAFKYRASQVEHVDAYSTDKLDTAEFYDSAASDTFTAGPDSVQMTTPSGVSVIAHNFRYVSASSSKGGTDRAELTGKAGERDYFVGQPTQASLGDAASGTGSNYYIWVKTFKNVVATGQLGNESDTATLSGSAAADTFTSDFLPLAGNPTQRDPAQPYATFAGNGYSNTVQTFRYVTAVGGSSDLAHQYAVSATDSFSGVPASTVMYNSNFYYETRGFGEVHGHATGLAVSAAKARFADSTKHVLLEIAGTSAKLSNFDAATAAFAVWADDFGDVTATASTANTEFARKKVLDHVFALHLYGPWKDA